ncbi:MAG: PfkB family carbohydrate kinase, partial [Oscillospiraceae bacterium]|nr:PfkB family carbohydrate kinase [Oscillospiraceae bacterium]
RQTGLATIIVDKTSGRYVCYSIMGANGHISPGQVEQSLAEPGYDMVLMQLEMPLETAYRTYEAAKARGIPVFLDAGPAMEIPLERFWGIFVISPNEAETRALVGIDPVDGESAAAAAKKLYETARPQYVILKLGERGALLYDGKTPEMIPCRKVHDVVDTTAAGDVFGGAFAVRRCRGCGITESIRYAHAAAAICVSRKGAQPSMPDAEEVEAFYGGGGS